MGTFGEKIKRTWRKYRFYIVPGILIFIFIFLMLWRRIVITVEAGESAVLWRRFYGGTVTDRVFGEGLHLIYPWDKMTIYNVRRQETRHTLHVLTRNALTISLDLSIRYHPERDMLGILHKTIGPEYVRKIVIPEIESSLRTAIGGWDAESLYSSRRLALGGIIRDAIEAVGENYIIVNTVIIRKITFPELVQNAIEMKERERQKAEAYVYRLVREEREAERKRIEAEGYSRYNTILDASLTNEILRWKGVEATLQLSESNNTKVVLIGNSSKDMPIILNVLDEKEGSATPDSMDISNLPDPGEPDDSPTDAYGITPQAQFDRVPR